ncbi:MAG: YggT family protein [Actinomycetota bacterium]|nr:YggT family protein [Actinomycetota bacterium]
MSNVLCLILVYYSYVLLARVIMSFVMMFRPDWRPPSPVRAIIDVIYGLTEPPLAALRKVIPQPNNFPLDVSFIVLIVIVRYILPAIICN